VAIDLSPTLVKLAQERLPATLGPGRITFRAGDMLDPSLGRFDHVVAMDSVIHYNLPDMVNILARFSAMSDSGVHFTYAPRTPALAAMHFVGKAFPRSDRSPRIVPHATSALYKRISHSEHLADWRPGRNARVSSGFYISHAQELKRI
jgi:magnesium-protoporphyrin O-methyltransferase